MNTVNPLWLIILSAVLALFPILVGLCTCYLKFSIVLGVVKSALGAQQIPGAIVTMAVSLVLTMFVMSAAIRESYQASKKIDFSFMQAAPEKFKLENLTPVFLPWYSFMRNHAGERELLFFSKLKEKKLHLNSAAKPEPPVLPAENKNQPHQIEVVAAAFVLTEIKEAFAMGFMLLLPFLVIDLVVANILVGLGMFMVSPVMISLPLKLLVFVVGDGWMMLMRGLIQSYAT